MAAAPTVTVSTGGKIKRALKMVWSVIVGIAVIAFVGLKIWAIFRKVDRAVTTVKDTSSGNKKPNSDAPKPAPDAPAPVIPPSADLIATGKPPPRQPGEDLQVLSFEIQKAKDGNLQYVVGVVTNHAAKQYFNVKFEFELTRKDGKTGDLASDSIRNLPANGSAPFKTSIIGNAPVAGAKLTKLLGEKE